MVKSELKKANWNNPLSAYNTSEYKQKLSKPKSDNHREKLSAAQSKLWKDNDYANNHANKVSKDYIVTDPQGNTYKIRNLTAHCKTYGLTRTLMLHVADGKQSHHKGWTCQKL
jgi:hypothetical protein